MKLYEIRAEYEEALAGAIDDATGEIIDERLADLLDEIEAKLDEKALDVAAYIVNLEAEADALKARATELSNRAKVAQRRAESLTEYLRRNLTAGTKLKDDRVSIGWRKSERVVLDAKPENLRREFQRWAVEADLSALKDALKSGDEDAYKVAHLETRQNIQVK